MLLIRGTLAHDLQLRYAGAERTASVNGLLFAYQGKTLQGDRRPDVPIRFSSFGDNAHFIAGNYKKGDRINVVADLMLNTYEKDGEKVEQLGCLVKAVLDDDTQGMLFTDMLAYCRAANDTNFNIPDRLSLSPEDAQLPDAVDDDLPDDPPEEYTVLDDELPEGDYNE